MRPSRGIRSGKPITAMKEICIFARPEYWIAVSADGSRLRLPGRNAAAGARRAETKNAREFANGADSLGRDGRREIDYTDNLPLQCLHPTGHWYEIPNMLGNGVLQELLRSRPQLRYLMVHNIDTVGASLDPGLLGFHIQSQSAITVEVIAREIEDHGGGLARINGSLRLVEGLALPSDKVEAQLSYYNTNTFWIDIDRLLAIVSLTRADLENEAKTATAVRNLAARMPSYITIKDVKKRWGKGQEDLFPVAQFEKLFVDMIAQNEVQCSYAAVHRERGQQLKEPAQLDGWLRDGRLPM